MTNQEILETLEGIQQLLSWQTQLVGNVVDQLRRQQTGLPDEPPAEDSAWGRRPDRPAP